MKRRDYYILGLLLCIVLYAASHRKEVKVSKSGLEKNDQELKADVGISSIDSLKSKMNQVIKVGF